jgi:hypothetical protein
MHVIAIYGKDDGSTKKWAITVWNNQERHRRE